MADPLSQAPGLRWNRELFKEELACNANRFVVVQTQAARTDILEAGMEMLWFHAAFLQNVETTMATESIGVALSEGIARRKYGAAVLMGGGEKNWIDGAQEVIADYRGPECEAPKKRMLPHAADPKRKALDLGLVN